MSIETKIPQNPTTIDVFMRSVVIMLTKEKPCGLCPGAVHHLVTLNHESYPCCVMCRKMVDLPALFADADELILQSSLDNGDTTPCPCHILEPDEAVRLAHKAVEEYYNKTWTQIMREHIHG